MIIPVPSLWQCLADVTVHISERILDESNDGLFSVVKGTRQALPQTAHTLINAAILRSLFIRNRATSLQLNTSTATQSETEHLMGRQGSLKLRSALRQSGDQDSEPTNEDARAQTPRASSILVGLATNLRLSMVYGDSQIKS
ncbi:hypothetical protein H2200_006727 [Cladophialophora chaetospira]|uniref:Uncharacterized protein n=1 Tax=Cladophialophora chaetospira TaxID=386627 RepID=A0AA38X8R6_9EURO|nr:hypothetical protein H2200_006727 [Cladophialophora chaetospira]